jgi:hypothetical protein
MQRRLRITLAAVAAAGVAVLGAGTAEAQGAFSSDKDKGCEFFDKDKPEKETDFPSYGELEAEKNSHNKDLREASSGKVYNTHNDYCDPGKPWRGNDWHDKSYDTLGFKRAPGEVAPSSDPHKNNYADWNGYNKSFRKDPHKYTKLEPDHIGAPKHPKYATE